MVHVRDTERDGSSPHASPQPSGITGASLLTVKCPINLELPVDKITCHFHTNNPHVGINLLRIGYCTVGRRETQKDRLRGSCKGEDRVNRTERSQEESDWGWETPVSSTWVFHACNPSVQRQTQQDSESLPPTHSRFSERHCSKNKDSWADGSVVKGACCSYRGLRFNSQHLYESSQHAGIPFPRNLMPAFGLLDTRHIETQTNMQAKPSCL